MQKLTQQLQNAFNDTKIKDGDCFDRLATFIKIKIEDLRELKTIYNKLENLCDSAFCDLDFLNNNNH